MAENLSFHIRLRAPARPLHAFSHSKTNWKLISVAVCVCFITAGPITKLFAWGEEESGGHVL